MKWGRWSGHKDVSQDKHKNSVRFTHSLILSLSTYYSVTVTVKWSEATAESNPGATPPTLAKLWIGVQRRKRKTTADHYIHYDECRKEKWWVRCCYLMLEMSSVRHSHTLPHPIPLTLFLFSLAVTSAWNSHPQTVGWLAPSSPDLDTNISSVRPPWTLYLNCKVPLPLPFPILFFSLVFITICQVYILTYFVDCLSTPRKYIKLHEKRDFLYFFFFLTAKSLAHGTMC